MSTLNRNRQYFRLLILVLVLGALFWTSSIFGILPSLQVRLALSLEPESEASTDASSSLTAAKDLEDGLDRGKLRQDASKNCTDGTKKVKLATGRHVFRADGLVEVNPEGAHPIFELIRQAETAWNEKLANASSSLSEAIGEYRRRYRRNPPKGFDKWWNYVEAHNVQLPDEYDAIYEDLEPFWGLEPSYLHQLQAEREFRKATYTIGKNDKGKLDMLNASFEEGLQDAMLLNANLILELLRDIEDDLPSFRAVFTPHDVPSLLSDYFVKSAVLEAAATHTYLSNAQLPPVQNLGWRSACPPDSPARRIEFINLDEPPPPRLHKTFIYNHLQAMDPCSHPGLFWIHGQFLSYDLGPSASPTMIPEFASSSTTLHHNIRIPNPYLWIEDIFPRSDDPEFFQRNDDRLVWRGTNTGIYHASWMRWQNSHRDYLVRTMNEVNGTIELLSSPKEGEEEHSVGPPLRARKARINPAIMDIGFAPEPLQCEPETCELMRQLFEFRKMQSMKDAGNYKYVLDVDGNGWSGRFKRLMTSNSLVFKSTIYPEWLTERVAPWVHYIPIQVDLSDLHDALIFFRGDANGEGAHEELARKIALQGRDWSKKFWRREDMVAYFYRLILEYARLMSLDRESMTYQGEGVHPGSEVPASTR